MKEIMIIIIACCILLVIVGGSFGIFKLYDNYRKSCPDGQKWDKATEKCICTDKSKKVDANKKCIDKCSSEQKWDKATEKCIDKCSSEQKWDKATEKCICTDKSKKVDANKNCVDKCSSEQKWDEDLKTCVCNDPTLTKSGETCLLSIDEFIDDNEIIQNTAPHASQTFDIGLDELEENFILQIDIMQQYKTGTAYWADGEVIFEFGKKTYTDDNKGYKIIFRRFSGGRPKGTINVLFDNENIVSGQTIDTSPRFDYNGTEPKTYQIKTEKLASGERNFKIYYDNRLVYDETDVSRDLGEIHVFKVKNTGGWTMLSTIKNFKYAGTNTSNSMDKLEEKITTL